MKLLLYISFGIFTSFLSSCKNSPSNYLLEPKTFAQEIKNHSNAIVLDVTTPEEFNQSHLANAINIDWYSELFGQEAQKLPKNNPIFIYCYSGARSASAASFLREQGFKEVYELNGGLMNWRSNHLAETTSTARTSQGMSLNDFQKIIEQHPLVLVDFNAPWCVPCKKMTPIVNEIAQQHPKIHVLKINVDEHPTLSDQLNITGIPTFQIYRNNKLTYKQTGMVSKETLLQQLQ